MINESLDVLMEFSPWVIYIFVFLFGLCIGSFLNVCIYRIPERQTIVSVPSHCMTCGKKLHWYELIPLFSWLALRGKCHGCKAKISFQYPLVELANALIWIVVLFFKGPTIEMICTQLMISTLLVISVIDARTMEIPFCLNVFIGIVAVIKLIFYHDNWLDNVLGAVILGGFFFLLIFVSNGRAMGGGDAKLVTVIGLFLGLKLTILGLALGCILGSIIHLILMATKKAGRTLAFGPYLSLGFAISSLVGNDIIQWYVSTFLSDVF